MLLKQRYYPSPHIILRLFIYILSLNHLNVAGIQLCVTRFQLDDILASDIDGYQWAKADVIR